MTAPIIPISSFDPGIGKADRWDVALLRANTKAAQGRFTLYIPEGTYDLTKHFKQTNIFDVLGSGPGTVLSWSVVGDAGWEVTRDAGTSKQAGLRLIGPSPWNAGDIGLLVNGGLCGGGSLSFLNWGRAGMHVEGNVLLNTAANDCCYTDLLFNLCGHGGGSNPWADGAGLYVKGADANACTFISAKAFDCRTGIFDESFLGNTYVGCTAEACNNRFDVPPPEIIQGRGFVTTNANAGNVWIGCYVENDSEADINYPSMVFGRQFQNRGNALVLGPLGAVAKLAAVNYYYDAILGQDLNLISAIGGAPGDGLSMSVSDANTGALVYHSQRLMFNPSWAHGWWCWNYAGLTAQDWVRFKQSTAWLPYTVLRGLLPGAGAVGVRDEYGQSTTPPATPEDGGSWQVGDIYTTVQPTAGQPDSWRVVSISPTVWKVRTTLAA